MIIDFTVGNFLSFQDKRTLSFQASGISELPENIIKIGKNKLLRSGVVYGANSSGKSNLIKGIDRMRDLLLNSVKLNDNDLLEYSPFLLSNKENEPTFFEMEFYHLSKIFRYGFEYNEKKILNEWLFLKQGTKKEAVQFIRTIDGIGVSPEFEEGIGKEKSTNDNRLFVSLVAQLGGKTSKKILEWFRGYNVLSGIEHKDYTGFSLRMLHKKIKGCEESLSLYQKLKLGFTDIKVKEAEFNTSELPSNMPDNLRIKLVKEFQGKTMVSIKTVHNRYDKSGQIIGNILFDKDENESEGTKKIIDLSGPIFDTLLLGKILIIDELDAKLHPLITIQIVKLFNNPDTNPNNAQLFFATHDTNLLNSELFRRDQIWFTEKDATEQTDLYSLIEFKLPDGSKVRNDSNLERNYIRGRYGAIPFITY
jgi:AAA15 family ATPase/GTPase